MEGRRSLPRRIVLDRPFTVALERTTPTALFLFLVLLMLGEIRAGAAALVYSLFTVVLFAFEYRKALRPEM